MSNRNAVVGTVILPLDLIQNLRGKLEHRFAFIVDHHVDYHYVIRRRNGLYLFSSTHYFGEDTLLIATDTVLDIIDYLHLHHGYSYDFILKSGNAALSEVRQ